MSNWKVNFVTDPNDDSDNDILDFSFEFKNSETEFCAYYRIGEDDIKKLKKLTKAIENNEEYQISIENCNSAEYSILTANGKTTFYLYTSVDSTKCELSLSVSNSKCLSAFKKSIKYLKKN